jgi:periplasmic protein TonB
MLRNRRYPAAAKSRGEHGIVHVLFRLDRQGRVTGSRIVRSSGFKALDNAALELVRRAQPFPTPPSDLTDAQLELSMPINYLLPP